MIPLRLGAALVSVCLGVVLCTRRKQPLFFKILDDHLFINFHGFLIPF